jgi:glycosyltransferase involved in cell wall biosynthesis
VHDLYFVAHLVLYLSLDEGFGLPILEAGAARTPIAVTQIPVFREIANDGVLYLPTDESPEFNANRLMKFLKENLSKSDLLFKRVFSRYNWQTYWQDYLKPIFEE